MHPIASKIFNIWPNSSYIVSMNTKNCYGLVDNLVYDRCIHIHLIIINNINNELWHIEFK